MNNRVIKNAAWMIGCKIAQSLINFVIGLLTARYLGPSNYGILSYAMSIVAFAVPLMQLGLNQTLVREFVKRPNQEGQIMGTALVINIASALFCMLGTLAFVMIMDAGDKNTILITALYSVILLFQATEMTRYWFQSKLLSRYPSIAALCAYIVVALYKVYLLVTQKSVSWFALSNVLDYLLISLIMIVIYKEIGGQRLSINWKLGREMLSRSKYYIIPSLMVMVFQHTDRIMIKLMLGEAETGVYSAAIACIGITGFLYLAVIDSARPVILEMKERDQTLFEKRMIQLYSIITCMTVGQSLVMTLFAKPIVQILFGSEYARAASVLAVAVWYITFGHYSLVRDIWVLAEEKQKYLARINIAGAIANVLLNYLLIPIWGAIGAAIASIITQFFTNVIVGLVIKPMRRNNYLMARSWNPYIVVDLLRKIIKKC